MNAYELSEQLKHWSGNRDELWNAANMLRQQADRIAELEGEVSHLKHINKNWSISEGWALQRVSELEKENSNLKYEISSGAWQPKEATDQELFNIYAHLQDTYEGDNFPVALGRTILKLYTTPQTKPLSDEEINDIVRKIAKYEQALQAIANDYHELSDHKIEVQNRNHKKWAREALE